MWLWIWAIVLVCVTVTGQAPTLVKPADVSIMTKPVSRLGRKLEKKAFNDRVRLMFVSGLEGTGHHAVRDMLTVCGNGKKCEKEPIVGSAAMRFDSREQASHGLFGNSGRNQVMDEVATIENRLNVLKNVPGDHLYYFGLESHLSAGEMSYPNGNSRDKALDNPDVYSMAIIAESVGFDFRILVLQRNASEIIASAIRRGFGYLDAKIEGMEPKVLIAAAFELYGQLSLLDRRFFECVKYNELGSMSEAKQATLVDFLHPVNLKGMLPIMMKTVRKHNRRQRKLLTTAVPPPMEERSLHYHIMMLNQYLGLIDNLCDEK